MPKNPQLLRVILFIAIGVLLIVFSTFLVNRGVDWLHALVLNLGIVAVATMLIEHLWLLCGGAPIENQIDALSHQVDRLGRSIDVIEAINEVGLTDVSDRLGNFGTQHDWVELLADAGQSADLMGRVMHGWVTFDGFPDLLSRKIRDGVKFRILLMSPENPFQDMLTEEGSKIDSVLTQKRDVVLGVLSKIRVSLPQELRSSLQVRLFNRVPLYCSIVRIDDVIYWSPYLCSNQAQNCPLLIVKGRTSGWGQLLEHEFQSVWNFATPVQDDAHVTQSE